MTRRPRVRWRQQSLNRWIRCAGNHAGDSADDSHVLRKSDWVRNLSEARPNIRDHAKNRLLSETLFVLLHHPLDALLDVRGDQMKKLHHETAFADDGTIRRSPLAGGIPDGCSLRKGRRDDLSNERGPGRIAHHGGVADTAPEIQSFEMRIPKAITRQAGASR